MSTVQGISNHLRGNARRQILNMSSDSVKVSGMAEREAAVQDTPDPPPGAVPRDPPLTARGARTRASLVAAARAVFERDGYLESRLSDITQEARCSIGTFYTYFSDKEKILMAVLDAAQHDMLHPGMGRLNEDESDPVDVIEASHRAYFESYRRNAKLMMVFEQVATVNPEFRTLRGKRSEAFRERNARSIADLQEQGLVDRSLDPRKTSLALNGMISRLAYHVFALGLEPDLDIEDLVEISTRLWANALRLPLPD